MVKTWRKVLIGLGLSAYLRGVGMLVSVAIERMRDDRHRSEVLGRYEQALREWQTYGMALEKNDKNTLTSLVLPVTPLHSPWTSVGLV